MPIAVALSISLLSAGACVNMTRIDRAIDREVERKSAALGMSATPPTVRSRPWESDLPEDAYERSPSSANPDPDELEYRGLPADRDVLSRIETYAQAPPDTQVLNLEEVWRVSQVSGREYLTAEEEYLLAAIRLLIERHLWGPRFFDDLSVQFDGSRGAGGSYQSAMNVINDLRVTQRLPYGGDVEARLVTQATQQLAGIVGEPYSQSAQLVFGADIPLLRDAGLIAQEDLIQANRDLVYSARDFENFRRDFLFDIASDYFDIMLLERSIINQEERLDSVIALLERTRALVEAGRQAPFEASNVEQNVLSSRASLISARESYILALDRFKVRLGIPVETPIRLRAVELELQDPDVTVSRAAQIALEYRLDLQNEADRLDDANRGVKNARNQLLPSLDVNASATVPTDDDDRIGGLDFDFNDTNYQAGITFGLPLDREIERLQLRQSLISLEQQRRNLEQFEDNVILEARAAVREIDRARFSLELQEQSVQINERRVQELSIREDEVNAQDRLDAENELLNARNQRDVAIRDLRLAILDYLRVTGQLRVAPEGSLLPLSGMTFEVFEAGGDQDPADPADPANPAPGAAADPALDPTNPALPRGTQVPPDDGGPDPNQAQDAAEPDPNDLDDPDGF